MADGSETQIYDVTHTHTHTHTLIMEEVIVSIENSIN